MHGLGNVQRAVQGMRALKPPRNETPDLKQKTAKKTTADNEATEAVINSWHTQDSHSTSENTPFSVYSEPSEYVRWLRSEIEAINSFDGFLLGVHDKIEKFEKHTQFGLEQILDVEKHNAELYESLELYKFTLRRIQADALKALRCQGNLGPQRVLHLLKETIAKENTADQVIEQQTTTNQKQNE
jgi:hypothetical protein